MISNKLKAVIKSRGLTLPDVASMIGTDKTNVYRAFRENRVITLMKIVEALNLEIILKDKE